MSMRLASRRIPNGRDGASIRRWAMIFLAAGIVGQSVIHNGLLSAHTMTQEQLSDAMGADPMVMGLVTLALMCKVVETCAAPLLAFLLVEGVQRTSSFEKYLLRIGAVALVSELPYNLAYSGRLLAVGSRNPVFGLFICLIMLYFFSRYDGKSLKNILMKLVIFVAAILWCKMLRIDQGVCLVILTGTLWLARANSGMRSLYAFAATMLCTMFSIYYMGACLSCIMLHRYNEERGEQNVKLNYAFYPALMLICGVISLIIG